MGAWSDFKANPSVGTYLAWVRGSYTEYDAARVEQDLTVGGDIALLASEAADLGEEAAKQILDEALNIGEIIVNATLDVVRGLGGAIIDGLDNAFDSVGEKLSGKEPAVIAGITTATIGLLTVILLFHTAKKGL